MENNLKLSKNNHYFQEVTRLIKWRRQINLSSISAVHNSRKIRSYIASMVNGSYLNILLKKIRKFLSIRKELSVIVISLKVQKLVKLILQQPI